MPPGKLLGCCDTLMASIFFRSFTLLLCFTIVKAQVPPNDACAGATVLPSTLPSVTTTTNFLKATATGSDPNPSCFMDSNTANPNYSVWYRWTPTTTGNYTFSTTGSVRDPTLPADFGNFLFSNFAIYKGSNCTTAALELTACASVAYLTNVVLQANETYFIFVRESDYRSVYDTSAGLQVLRLAATPPPPANDECTTAVVIPPDIVTPYEAFAVDVDQATQNDAADLTCQLTKGDSVWARWTPAVSGTYDITVDGSRTVDNTTFSDFIRIGVYQGDSCATATEVACDVGTVEGISIQAGTTYFIKAQAQDIDNTLGGKVRLEIQTTSLGFFRRLIRCILAFFFGN